MDIPLNVRKRCVLFAVKRAYDQVLNQALSGSDMDPEVGERLEVLRRTLEEMDLIGLRGQYPELAGGSDADVRLQTDTCGTIILFLDGRKLKSIHKTKRRP